MIFKRGSKPHSSMSVAVLASLAFIALAMWGWDLPGATVLNFLWICLALVTVVIAAAALVIAIIKLPHFLRKRKKSGD